MWLQQYVKLQTRLYCESRNLQTPMICATVLHPHQRARRLNEMLDPGQVCRGAATPLEEREVFRGFPLESLHMLGKPRVQQDQCLRLQNSYFPPKPSRSIRGCNRLNTAATSQLRFLHYQGKPKPRLWEDTESMVMGFSQMRIEQARAQMDKCCFHLTVVSGPLFDPNHLQHSLFLRSGCTINCFQFLDMDLFSPFSIRFASCQQLLNQASPGPEVQQIHHCIDVNCTRLCFVSQDSRASETMFHQSFIFLLIYRISVKILHVNHSMAKQQSSILWCAKGSQKSTCLVTCLGNRPGILFTYVKEAALLRSLTIIAAKASTEVHEVLQSLPRLYQTVCPEGASDRKTHLVDAAEQ